MKFSPQWSYRVLFSIAIVLAVVFLVAIGTSQRQWIAPSLSGCFLCFAFAAGGYPTLRKWAFTIWIATAVAAGLTHPTWFISVGDFKFTKLFVPILQVIMFCMETTLSVGDFVRVFRMPVGVLVGLGCQFTIMPFLGYGLAKGFGLPPEIAAGIVLVRSVGD